MQHLPVYDGFVDVDSGEAVPARPSPTPPGIASIDERLGEVEHREFQPVLVSAETDTSNSSFTELARYTAPDGRVGLLDEVSIQTDSNGEIILSLQGSEPTTFSSSTAFTAPWNGAYLYPGQRVRVLHRLSGTGTATNKAAITVREV